MTSLQFPARPSDADRERALELLREGAAQGRLSQDTFLRRLELVLSAQHQSELELVTADLECRGKVQGLVLRMVGRASAFNLRVRRAWRTERLPKLLLPEPGPFPLLIGRSPGVGLRLNHETVSRNHAELRSEGKGWMLRDLGSTNGTCVNGRRLVGEIAVGPGDHIRFGQVDYVLTERQEPTER
ncbi:MULTISPECIES: FHA domain-containing protein [unclassified Streptomyces]|uniref:FHA domain-containing protein n=1 Tax=unclassified Streptomyces TaxID=2593676 RepID=UPI0036B5E810